MNTIFEEVIKSEAGRSLTLDRVRASLVQLGCSSSGIDETYSVGTVCPLCHFRWFLYKCFCCSFLSSSSCFKISSLFSLFLFLLAFYWTNIILYRIEETNWTGPEWGGLSDWSSFCCFTYEANHPRYRFPFIVPGLQVESIVLNRYGRDAYRMFRLLSKTGQLLETNKVMDFAFRFSFLASGNLFLSVTETLVWLLSFF